MPCGRHTLTNAAQEGRHRASPATGEKIISQGGKASLFAEAAGPGAKAVAPGGVGHKQTNGAHGKSDSSAAKGGGGPRPGSTSERLAKGHTDKGLNGVGRNAAVSGAGSFAGGVARAPGGGPGPRPMMHHPHPQQQQQAMSNQHTRGGGASGSNGMGVMAMGPDGMPIGMNMGMMPMGMGGYQEAYGMPGMNMAMGMGMAPPGMGPG